jgi:CheY-like chemotaxis protein
VEDNAVNREVAMGMLENLGYRADVVPDGASALRALRETAYSLVLTDCQLPEMDGYELSRLIRNPSTNVLNPSIPIIAVTAHSLSGDREECRAAGMDDYLTKPLLPEQLDQAVTRWIGCEGSAAPDVNPLPAQPGLEESESQSQFDEAGLIDRLMGNAALAKRVATEFVNGMPQQLAALADAIGASNAEAIMFAAHSIKGSAANVGSVAICESASRLEKFGKSGSLVAAGRVLPELIENFESLKPVIERFCERAG